MWKMPKLRPPVRSNREGYFIVILTMGFLIQLTALGFGRFAYTAILPSMKTDLGLTNTHMGFFQVAILTGYLLFAYLSGALVKRWSLTVTINLSVALVGIAMTALGFFSSFPLLLLLAFLIGSGAAGSSSRSSHSSSAGPPRNAAAARSASLSAARASGSCSSDTQRPSS
jgi:sugar phosphate permease